MNLNFNTVAREICKREESNSREVNITDVKRVMRWLFQILEEEKPADVMLFIGTYTKNANNRRK